MNKAMKEADDADLIIYVIDSSGEMNQEDHDLLSYLKDKKAIVILNKTDLEQKIQIKDVEEITNLPVIAISAKENTGIDLLEKQVHHLFIAGEITYNDQVYVTNVRHKSLIAEAISSLNLVLKSIEDQMPEDFYSVDLMNAYKQLGLIIGESVEDDLVEEIFSKFCMGK